MQEIMLEHRLRSIGKELQVNNLDLGWSEVLRKFVLKWMWYVGQTLLIQVLVLMWMKT